MLGSKEKKKEQEGGVTSASGQITVPRDGRVHASIQALSITRVGDAWNRGNALDMTLQDLQDQGAEIVSVNPYGLGDEKTARAVVVFRAPKEGG